MRIIKISAVHLFTYLGVFFICGGWFTLYQFTYPEAKQLEKEGWERVPRLLEQIEPPIIPSRKVNVKQYGAKGDSISNDLPAILRAIDACSQKGGGQVYIPEGVYFCRGPIHLKSKIELYIEKGAKICFSQQAEDYLPAVKVRWEGTVCYNYSPFIYGYQLTDVSIRGEGEIDGQGESWSESWRALQKPDQQALRQMGNDQTPERERVFANGFLDLDQDGKDDGNGDGLLHFLRPTLIELYECKRILIEGLTIRNSVFWTVHPVFSQQITLKDLHIYGQALNDDGIDPDGCEYVLIEGCEIQTRDDAISIKAGRDQDAWDRPGSKHIVIRNNQLLSGANALCIGSEMSGGVQYVYARENTIANGQHALNFKCNLDRGGEVSHIYLRDFQIASCRDAMFIFRMDYHGYRGNQFPTKFHNFFVSKIQCERVEGKAFKIVGLAQEPVKNIMLDSIQIGFAGESHEITHADNLLFHSVILGDSVFQFDYEDD